MKTLSLRSVILLGCLAFTLMLVTEHSVYAQNECNSLGAPTSTTGSITAGDTAQSLRLFRDGRNTTCTFNRTATTSAGAYNSDQYMFTNTSGGTACVFVDLNTLGCGVATNQLSIAAYSPTYNPASILTNLIADPGLSTGQSFNTSLNFSIAAGASYVIVVHNINAGTTCASYTFTQQVFNGCRHPGYDAANDGSSDLAVFRPGTLANWYSQVIGGAGANTQFGTTGDIPVPGDYNGDEATDVAVFRPSNGTWYTSTSAATNYGAKQWGVSGDVPVQGDYDRDGITDIGVFRPSDNNWYILRSSDGSLLQSNLAGAAGDKAVPSDYDGDGRMDIAIWRPSNGLWTILASSQGGGGLANQLQFGLSTDLPVPADYDGDGKSDVAIFRPSEGAWYIFRTSLTANQVLVVPFGASGDNPQPADYDGDRKVDQAVFRPSTATWYVRRSTTGDIAVQFGAQGDTPVSRANAVQ